ncbi:MAG: hypothetical protein ABH950_07885 [Candidatus Altiarchaeota archaeon]
MALSSGFPPNYKSLRFGPVQSSNIELRDLTKAWLVISTAFTILMLGGATTDVSLVFFVFFSTLLTAGAGFISHELAHKFTAQSYGCFSEFRADNQMLTVALLSSFLGFLFAAPGAVVTYNPVTRKENGLISVSGPVANIVLAFFFLVLSYSPVTLFSGVAFFGFKINSWLALFNLIPIGGLDGAKVWQWNKIVHVSLFFVALIFSFMF